MPSVPPSARGAVITGWGTALPDKVVTNDDLRASGLDTSDEWIVERTGIKERRVGGSTASLSTEAGRQAWDRGPTFSECCSHRQGSCVRAVTPSCHSYGNA